MPKNTYHEYLKMVPLFADLDDDELDEVGSKATDVNMKAGTVIMREGSTAHEMVIVTKGTLEVTREGEHIADIGSGGFAGEMALLTRTHRNSTVTAKTDVELLHIDGRDFAGLLEDVPRIAVKMLPIIVQRVVPHED
jgi:CRP/FNR family cyclic AMP-dependent transcriptional regulator